MWGAKPGGGCDITGLVKEMWDAGESFSKDKQMKARFGPEASTIVNTVFEKVFSLPVEQLGGVKLTKGTIRTFQRKLDTIKFASNKGKLTSQFGSLFYTPESIIQKNPQLMILHDNLLNTSLNYQGRTGRHKRSYEKIMLFAKRYMLEKEYGDNLDPSFFQKRGAMSKLKAARKLANRHEMAIEKLSFEADSFQGSEKGIEARELLAKALKAEDKFYKKQEGRVFTEILETIEKTLPKLHKEADKAWYQKVPKLREALKKGHKVDGKAMTRRRYEAMRKKALDPILSKEIKSEPLKNLIEEYTDMMDEMYSVTEHGVKAYIKSIKEGMKGKYTSEKIDEIADKIYKKILPDKMIGYYPHYRRVLSVDFLDNLMPHMQRVADATAESFTKDSKNLDKVIDEMNAYVTGHTKKRQIIDLGTDMDATQEYSRNFLPTIKRYMDEIDRFNMVAHADQYTREALNAAKKMFKSGEPIDGFAQATADMMVDLNARMKGGYGFENANAEAAMKTLLALEFTSKLGFNLRSPFKNATQGLLNFVEFGPIKMAEARNFYKNDLGMKGIVNDMMDEAGFLFSNDLAPELIESQAGGGSFTTKIKITNNETVEFKKPARLAGIHQKASKGAAISGKLMGKVENFNRKTTFKVAFYEMYNRLKNSSEYATGLRDAGMSESQVRAEILKRSRNYAIKKTTLLHFDYGDISKASWITHPAGRLLGQFQHYGIKFFEYNLGIAREAKDDVMAGELLGDRAQKAYKMALIYALVPVIASSVTGLDFGNIIEHDTKEKIAKLWTLFTGDDDEIKKAYYGKGVLTQLPFIGAPVVSDAIALGNVVGFLDMDVDTKGKLIAGWEDYALKSGDQKAYEILRTLNTSIARLGYKTLPTFLSEGPGAALQYELGLYKTIKSKKMKEALLEGSLGKDPLLPEELLAALDALGGHIDAATLQRIKREGFKTDKSKAPSNYLLGKGVQ